MKQPSQNFRCFWTCLEGLRKPKNPHSV